jgi:hypothetical protein
MIDTSNNIYERFWGTHDYEEATSKKEFSEYLEAEFDNASSFDKVLSTYSLTSGELLYPYNPITVPYDLNVPTYSGNRYQYFCDEAVAAAKQLILEYLVKPESDNGRFVANMVKVIMGLNKKSLSSFWAQAYTYWDDCADGSYESVAKFESLVIIAHAVIEAKYKEEIPLENINSLVEYSVRQGDAAKTCRSRYNAMNYSELIGEAFGLKLHYAHKSGDIINTRAVCRDAMEAYAALIDAERAKGGHYLGLAIKHSGPAMYYAKEAGETSELAALKQAKDEMECKQHEYRISGQDPCSYQYSKSYEIPYVSPEQFGITGFHGIVKALFEALVQATARENIRDHIKSNRLSNIFDNRTENEDGVTVFSALDPVEDCSTCDAKEMCRTSGCKCFKSREVINLSERLHLWSAFCHVIIASLKELDNVAEMIEKALIDKAPNTDRVYTIQLGVEQWLQGHHYTALRLICPEFEYLLRECIKNRGGITSDTSVRVDKVNTLKGFLRKNKDIEWASQDIKWLIEALLTSEPLNLRNKTSHGLSVQSDGAISALIVLLLYHLITGRFSRPECVESP